VAWSEEYVLKVCNVAKLRESLEFWRNASPPSSGLKIRSS
jgi:hypothetical protein